MVEPVGDECPLTGLPAGQRAGTADKPRRRRLGEPAVAAPRLVHVLPKPGVMDPVAQSVLSAIADFGIRAEAVRTLKKYWIGGLSDERLGAFASKVLANDAIEQVVVGPLAFDRLEVGSPYEFRLATVPLRQMDDAGMERLSLQGQLYLSLAEMRTIQAHFQSLGRDPTDVELETVAQTWSEHCSHKTLAGRIRYREAGRERNFENMLRETIFAATEKIRNEAGPADWCVSVFRDNAGVVRFDDQYNLVFKVETHNHPSALEPYGGANTGLGGVIRDPMGTGMGARPVCNTDVFCFAPPDTPAEQIPPGVLHPRRVIKGVVSGVRDYGNRMGIPTVNGAIYFDSRYLGNPLVFCGNIGLIPADKSFKRPRAGDLIVAVGGRTGRDGIHGATFSSAELTSQSETVSGGAVQIGNAITEKMLLDVLLAARDRGLYNAVTDCGAGGFSSAVGEMGEKIGAEVWLDRVPLKYEGLSYTENLDFRGPGADGARRAAGKMGRLVGAVRLGGRRGHGDRPLRSHRPAAVEIQRPASGRPGDGLPPRRPPAGRARRRLRPAAAGPAGPPGAAGRKLYRRAAADPRLAQRLQQGVGHPPVRPRGAGRQRAEAAGRGGQRRPRRRRRAAAGAAEPPRHRRRLRHESPLRRAGSVPHGRQRHRRGGPQLHRGRRRSAAHRHPRQFLLGQHRAARDAGLAGPRRLGLLRRGHGLGHALHQRQGQPQQRIPPQRRRADLDSTLALDQRAGPDRRREPLRHHGPERGRQLPLPGRPDAGRDGRFPLRPGRVAHRRRDAGGRSAAGDRVLHGPAPRRSTAGWSAPATT